MEEEEDTTSLLVCGLIRGSKHPPLSLSLPSAVVQQRQDDLHRRVGSVINSPFLDDKAGDVVVVLTSLRGTIMCTNEEGPKKKRGREARF